MTWQLRTVRPGKVLQELLEDDWEPFSVTATTNGFGDDYRIWLRKLDD